MPEYRRTQTPGIFVRHEQRCPAGETPGARCRCKPSYRGKRWDARNAKAVWSRSSKDRAEILTWLAANAKGAAAVTERLAAGPTFRQLAEQWLEGVEAGAIGKRRGKKGSVYSDTTLTGYRRSLRNYLLPEFGEIPAGEIVEVEWQMWVDRLAREGSDHAPDPRPLSRSRIANHVAVASAVYGWACRPTRLLVARNPLLAVELPPNDEQPRLRVAGAGEAAELLDALAPADRVPYALAFYAGMRRSEIHRLDWTDVDLDTFQLHVRRSKSEAGTHRRPPLPRQLRPILLRAHMQAGKPAHGPVSPVSVMTGKLAERATQAWTNASTIRARRGLGPLERITLHECRHTYASFLMAARYTTKEIMEFGGWADLQMVQRYVKLLPQPGETEPSERLDAFLAAGSQSA